MHVPVGSRILRTCWVGALFVAAAPTRSYGQTSDHVSSIFGTRTVVGESLDFAEPLSLDRFADGSILVLDWKAPEIARITPRGQLLWRSGRRGGGPGEFQFATRAIVTADQSVLVFEVGKPGVAKFTADGRYAGELRPDMQVTFSSAVVLPSGEIAILGHTRDLRGRDAVVHIFDSQLRHVRSFGPRAEATTARIGESFGAGGLTLNIDGTLMHTRMFPYEVRRYARDGQLLSTTRMQVSVSTPEENVHISVNDGRMTTRVIHEVTRAIPVRLLPDGHLLGGRIINRVGHIDLFDASGRLLSTMQQPAEWSALSIVDYSSSAFWMIGTKDDVPVLWHVGFGAGMTR